MIDEKCRLKCSYCKIGVVLLNSECRQTDNDRIEKNACDIEVFVDSLFIPGDIVVLL